MLPAVLRILRETLLNDVIERRGKSGPHTGDGGGIALQDFGDDAGLAWTRESPPPCCHLVQDGTEGKDVAPRVGHLAFQLLWRHIADRPKDDAFLGQVRGFGSDDRTRGQPGAHCFLPRPKSSSLAPARVNMIFPGLRSRWQTD